MTTRRQDAHLLADTPVTASTEGLVWTVSSFAHSAEPIIDLFAVLIDVVLEGCSSNTFGIAPTRWQPLVRLLPYSRVHLADSGTSQNVVSFGNDEGAILGGSRKSRGNGNVVADIAHDAVDRWVNSEGLADDGVHQGEFAQLLEGEGPHLAVWRAEELALLLV